MCMQDTIRSLTLALADALLAAGAAAHGKKEVEQDIQRHRAMAAAHEAAARCLESGRKVADCHRELQAACKGIGIGKYCGMRHEH